MTKKLKILFIPLEAVGHINSAIGMAQVLKESGHEVIFAINKQWKGSFNNYDFEEVLFSHENKKEGVDPIQQWAEMLIKSGLFAKQTSLQNSIQWTKLMEILVDDQIKLDKIIEDMLPQIRPDLIICDQIIGLPSVEKSGIPWVLVCSCNPLFLMEDERTPPGNSGLPAFGHENEWKNFRNAIKEEKQNLLKIFNEYITSKGAQPLKTHIFINESPYLNIYGIPSELDYTDLRPQPPKWFRFDNFKRTDQISDFEIPNELRGKPGKLIYLSMGSMGCADVQLMKRLVTILSKSKHRFIVSKGPLHDKYELADNMWGQSKVPQIQLLSTVDLVISHGGNNTVSETFFYGKPMIVMPLFVDQFDNAQRIHEKEFGIRLDPYDFTEEELLNSIEKLLNDNYLNEKLKNISNRIQTDNSIAKLPQIMESLVFESDFHNNFE